MTKRYDHDFNLMIAEMNAECEAKAMLKGFIPEGSVARKVGMPTPEGMYYDTDVRRYCPLSFKEEKERIVKTEAQRILDSTPDEDNHGYSITGKPLNVVNEEDRNTGTPAAPTEAPVDKSKRRATAAKKESERTIEELPATTIFIDEPAPNLGKQMSETPGQSKPMETPTEVVAEAVEQSKKTRRSAKMDEADFGTLAAAFIFPADLAEKKPLFFPERTRESLRKVAGLVPGGKVSPSHVAIHIVNAWLDEHRDLLNRMFANKKTSI